MVHCEYNNEHSGGQFMTESRRNRKRKKRFNWTRFLGVLLILVAVGLLAMDPIKNYIIKSGQEANQVAKISRETIEKNEAKTVTYDFSDIKSVDAASVIMANINPNDLPTIGGVAVPSVKMNLPIYKGVSNEGMYLGAGTLRPDIVMGGVNNYSIASHHSIHEGLLFEPLERVQMGDAIFLTDKKHVYKYEVSSIEEVTPDRVDVLNDTGQSIVTLLTCDPTGALRVIVKGTLVETKAIDDATPEMMAAFELDSTVPQT